MLDTAPGAPAAGHDDRAPASSPLRALAARARHSPLMPLVVLWIAVIVYFALTESRFLTSPNITSMLEQNSVLFTVAMAETVILLTGAVDLSIGGMLSLTSLVIVLGNHGIPAWVVLIMTVLAGGLLSATLNGLPIGLGRMNPFVVTLGTSAVFFGIANLITGGNTEVIDDPKLINAISGDKVGPIPIAVLVMLAVLGLFWWMLRYTYFGRNVYAVGGNPEASTLAGISVARIRIVAFFLLGLSAGLAAILDAGQLSSVAPTSGSGLELQAVAAVLLGGTTLAGGKGGVVGTAIAVLFLGTVHNGLDISGVSSFWQGVVTGSVLVLAVGFDQVRQRFVLNRQVKGTR
ncbi:MAG TPA: ABC transporter permease [Conexibacter sp.]|jgi:ribose transport system permease protein